MDTNLQAHIAYMQSLGFGNEYIRSSLKAGLNECQRFIDREASRDPSLRSAKDQQYLDYCIAHKAELQAQIDALAA